MKIKPTRGKILARLIPEDKKIGNIYIARQNKEIPRRAKVLAVGDPEINKKGKEIKAAASIGNVVYMKRYSGDVMKYEGMDLIFLRNDDIVGKY